MQKQNWSEIRATVEGNTNYYENLVETTWKYTQGRPPGGGSVEAENTPTLARQEVGNTDE